MADIQGILYVFVSLLGLISALQVNLVLYNYLHHSTRSLRCLRRELLSRERFSRRFKVRQKRKYWVKPGRTSLWWDNFTRGAVPADEWKLNFRMSKSALVSLAELLCPHIEGQATKMRAPIDVVKKVACTLYYLSDQGRMRKTANAFGLSQQTVSKIVRQVSVQLFNKSYKIKVQIKIRY